MEACIRTINFFEVLINRRLDISLCLILTGFCDLIFRGESRESRKMVTIPECEGLFEPLLRILEDKMAAGDDHVDAYLRMTEWVWIQSLNISCRIACPHWTFITGLQMKIDLPSPNDQIIKTPHKLPYIGTCIKWYNRTYCNYNRTHVALLCSLDFSFTQDWRLQRRNKGGRSTEELKRWSEILK